MSSIRIMRTISEVRRTAGLGFQGIQQRTEPSDPIRPKEESIRSRGNVFGDLRQSPKREVKSVDGWCDVTEPHRKVDSRAVNC